MSRTRLRRQATSRHRRRAEPEGVGPRRVTATLKVRSRAGARGRRPSAAPRAGRGEPSTLIAEERRGPTSPTGSRGPLEPWCAPHCGTESLRRGPPASMTGVTSACTTRCAILAERRPEPGWIRGAVLGLRLRVELAPESPALPAECRKERQGGGGNGEREQQSAPVHAAVHRRKGAAADVPRVGEILRGINYPRRVRLPGR